MSVAKRLIEEELDANDRQLFRSQKHVATKTDQLSETIREVLTSPNVCDANGEAANIVDTLGNLASAVWFGVDHRTDPKKRPNAMEFHAETIKSGLETVASAISDLASAIRERGQE